jgi:Family of unknown function (DUF5313)
MRTRVLIWEEAVRSLGIEPTPRIRPNPLRWLWYLVWGRLPERHRVWVLYDTTCLTWVIRHVLRLLLLAVLPVGAILLWLPAPLGVRGLTAFVAGFSAVLFTVVWVNEATEQRLVQAGWRWGIGPEVRRARAEMTERFTRLP